MIISLSIIVSYHHIVAETQRQIPMMQQIVMHQYRKPSRQASQLRFLAVNNNHASSFKGKVVAARTFAGN